MNDYQDMTQPDSTAVPEAPGAVMAYRAPEHGIDDEALTAAGETLHGAFDFGRVNAVRHRLSTLAYPQLIAGAGMTGGVLLAGPTDVPINALWTLLDVSPKLVSILTDATQVGIPDWVLSDSEVRLVGDAVNEGFDLGLGALVGATAGAVTSKPLEMAMRTQPRGALTGHLTSSGGPDPTLRLTYNTSDINRYSFETALTEVTTDKCELYDVGDDHGAFDSTFLTESDTTLVCFEVRCREKKPGDRYLANPETEVVPSKPDAGERTGMPLEALAGMLVEAKVPGHVTVAVSGRSRGPTANVATAVPGVDEARTDASTALAHRLRRGMDRPPWHRFAARWREAAPIEETDVDDLDESAATRFEMASEATPPFFDIRISGVLAVPKERDADDVTDAVRSGIESINAMLPEQVNASAGPTGPSRIVRSDSKSPLAWRQISRIRAVAATGAMSRTASSWARHRAPGARDHVNLIADAKRVWGFLLPPGNGREATARALDTVPASDATTRSPAPDTAAEMSTTVPPLSIDTASGTKAVSATVDSDASMPTETPTPPAVAYADDATNSDADAADTVVTGTHGKPWTRAWATATLSVTRVQDAGRWVGRGLRSAWRTARGIAETVVTAGRTVSRWVNTATATVTDALERIHDRLR